MFSLRICSSNTCYPKCRLEAILGVIHCLWMRSLGLWLPDVLKLWLLTRSNVLSFSLFLTIVGLDRACFCIDGTAVGNKFLRFTGSPIYSHSRHDSEWHLVEKCWLSAQNSHGLFGRREPTHDSVTHPMENCGCSLHQSEHSATVHSLLLCFFRNSESVSIGNAIVNSSVCSQKIPLWTLPAKAGFSKFLSGLFED